MAIEQIAASDWPAGRENVPLLVLPIEPDELTAQHGLRFGDDADDLGPLKIAVVRIPGFGVAGLIHRPDAPFGGTMVYVDEDEDLREALLVVLREFDVAESDVSEMNDLARQVGPERR